MEKKKEEQIQLNITVPDAQKAGIHANVAFLTVTSNGEAMIDFIFSHPNDKIGDIQQGTLVSRVVLPVKVAKDLNFILSAQLGKTIKE
jgi:uncharacterized protein YwlG (UPF0340 family)